MSTITAGPISGLTDEQRDFQTAIRDFADRECGTAEQREKLTNGYEELHNQEIYEQLGRAGLARRLDRRGVRRRRRPAWSTPASSSRRRCAG